MPLEERDTRADAIESWEAKLHARGRSAQAPIRFTRREESALRGAGRLELVRRAKAGAVAYVFIAVLIVLATPFGTRYPLLSVLIVGCNIVMGVVRLHLASAYEGMNEGRRRQVYPVLMFLSLITGALWGVMTGFAIWSFGLTYTTLVVVVCTAGIMAGGMVTLCVRYPLVLMYVAQMLGPSAIVGFSLHGSTGATLSFIFVIYMLFLAYQGLHLNRTYWVSLRRSLQVEIARLEAEEASRAKSQFLANMSHEIRTPMNGIIGITDIAMACDVSRSQHRHLSIVKNSAESLMTVIDGILDFSKVEAGMLELAPQPFELRDVLAEVLKTLASPAQEKRVELALDVEEGIPDALVGDDTRLRQVLLNIAGNAVKFTECGHVRLRVRRRSVETDQVRLEFQVEDTGIGIPRRRQKAIFKAFAQVDSSMAREFGGTGLGLSISASLVELLGGRIWLESVEGEGSTFFFTALFELGEAVPAEPPVGPPGVRSTLSGLQVLVAEDNPVNVLVARRLLERLGTSAATVGNGRLAVEAVEERDFDLIFMDVQMPGMDGLEATAQIRERERLGARATPIIALTAHALEGDRARCLAAGMDGFVTKPIDAERLVAEVRRVLDASEGLPERRAG